MQATGKTDARRMNWIQTLARKVITWKLPRWWNNMNNTVPSYTANAAKAAFTNIANWVKPVSWIFWWAEAVTLWGIADAVNIPYQWIRNLYNAWADFYNAWASNRNALLQEAILNRIQAENKDPFAVLDNPNTVYKKQQQFNNNLKQQWQNAYDNWEFFKNTNSTSKTPKAIVWWWTI